ncbi:MAG: cobalamin biosynthesis protein [Lachnospiraceae bacterium]|nr:cobalamin biosynthesis protein [Lachnospiraceae bacterium]
MIRCLYFSKGGEKLFERLCKSGEAFLFQVLQKGESADDFVKGAFELHIPLLFICSAGIAVRFIAPFVNDKLSDPPVIVMDEAGRYVIPILSGHYGGGYDIAGEIANSLSSELVRTSASDINNTFAIDVFAKQNGYYIEKEDHDRIKEINSLALSGEKVDRLKLPDGDIKARNLILHKKTLCLGMGCKKGKSFTEFKAFLNRFFDDEELEKELYAIGTIDVKAEEIGLLALAVYYGAFLFTFTKEELSEVEDEGLSSSPFVKETVGVDNVCERAALLLSGGSELTLSKKAGDGITLAAAKRFDIEPAETGEK